MSFFSGALVYKAPRLYILGGTLTFMVALGSSAVAQTPAAPAPCPRRPRPATAGAPIDAPPPASPPTAAGLPVATPAPSSSSSSSSSSASAATAELSTKIEETDLIARVAARKLELLEERLAATRQGGAGRRRRGQGVRPAQRRRCLLHPVRGDPAGRHALVPDDDPLSDKDTFLIRRLRPQLAGTVFGLADFLFVPDFAGSQAVVFDAYADVHPTPFLRLRAGKFKSPLGLERLQSDPDSARWSAR